ncbi:PHD finger protein 24-like isoform X2 [Biomphalaria glabrata]|uniref:PHD finger protein 24-like isoform X2 n=1 Tax=Biomphalaria glabrata TaxID=6526 RepID=A0A9W3AEL9_BIOGL|nr:PHD finger protein 24-like isoform X2 [Biomphalaria glabrata]
MGGNSSKSKKTNIQLSVTETLESSLNSSTSSQKDKKYNKNVNKKKKSNSVKIKADKKSPKKHKQSFCESQTIEQVLIEDMSVSGCKLLAPNSPVYRKKSSCPSCEAKDILLGKNRSRSGSERSLRFSDFNKVLRRTKVYEWEMTPLDIALEDVREPKPEDVCYICGVYTGHHVRICRVCMKAYHDGCLLKIGHPLTEKHRKLITSKQWSCHQCAALNHLLTQEEVRTALEDLQDLDICKDNITEESYLSYCKQSLNREGKIFTAEKEGSSLTRFHIFAKDKVVSWTDFLNMEGIRILSRRNKDSLVHLLTQSELAEARKTFKTLDKKGLGMVSKSEVQQFLDSTKTRVSSYFPDDSMMYIDEDLDSPVTWGDFLRDRAIYFLGQRINLMRATDGDFSEDNADKASTAMSFDSMDDDEEYTSCTPDFDQSSDHHCHHYPTTNAEPNRKVLDDISKEYTVRVSVNKTMLDDIDVELQKCHKLQELQASSSAESPETSSQATGVSPGLENVQNEDPDLQLNTRL